MPWVKHIISGAELEVTAQLAKGLIGGGQYEAVKKKSTRASAVDNGADAESTGEKSEE